MNVNFVDVDYVSAGPRGCNLPVPPYSIIPLEVHWSRRTKSNGFCKDTWKKALARIEKDPRAFVVFVGDMLDADRPSTRERKALMGLGRPEVLCEDDQNHMDELDEHLIPDLLRIKDKIIGAVDGDHYRIFGHQTSTKYIMGKLGIPKAYLGERMGWIRLTFKRGAKADHLNFDIFVRHGKGSATTFGTDVNALVRQSVGFDAQLYLGGHTHRQWFVKVPYLYCGRFDIKQRFVGYARAGSLLRGFLYGEATYAEAAEYNPLSIGWPEVYLYIHPSSANNGNMAITDMKGLT
jgi:hypothetical protein